MRDWQKMSKDQSCLPEQGTGEGENKWGKGKSRLRAGEEGLQPKSYTRGTLDGRRRVSLGGWTNGSQGGHTYDIESARGVQFDEPVEIPEQNRHRQKDKVGGISDVVSE